MHSYRSLFVFMDSNGSLQVFIGLICPYKSLFVMDFNVSLWVLRGFYASLKTLMGPNEFLWVFFSPYGSL